MARVINALLLCFILFEVPLLACHEKSDSQSLLFTLPIEIRLLIYTFFGDNPGDRFKELVNLSHTSRSFHNELNEEQIGSLLATFGANLTTKLRNKAGRNILHWLAERQLYNILLGIMNYKEEYYRVWFSSTDNLLSTPLFSLFENMTIESDQNPSFQRIIKLLRSQDPSGYLPGEASNILNLHPIHFVNKLSKTSQLLFDKTCFHSQSTSSFPDDANLAPYRDKFFWDIINEQLPTIFGPGQLQQQIMWKKGINHTLDFKFLGGHSLTPLSLAVLINDKQACEILLDNGADINPERYPKPLTIAASVGHMDMINFLIGRGAQCDPGDGAVISAAQNGHLDIVKYFLNKSQRSSRIEALVYAAKGGHIEIVKYLMDHGALPENPMEFLTRLLKAASAGRIGSQTLEYYMNQFLRSEDSIEKIAQIAADAGISLATIKDQDAFSEYLKSSDISLLMLGAKIGDLSTVKQLIEEGINVDEQNNEGFTALMYAAEAGYFEAVKILVENHASREPLNIQNLNAFMLAAKAGHGKIVRYLANLPN